MAYTRFCEEKDLHLVSDEIYALSTYSHPGTSLSVDRAVLILDFEDAEGFTSLLSLDVERELGMVYDRARLHGEQLPRQTWRGADSSGLWNEQRVGPRISPRRKADISFCANGLRVGALVSQHNPLLLRAMASTSMLMKSKPPFLASADE